MKVLALTGSPRTGGNSDILTDRFLKGAEEAGHETRKISLAKAGISPCTACGHCLQNNGQCVFSDDMEKIEDEIMSSDVVVLSTPVYYYSVSRQMKIFIDRTYNRFRDFAGKKFYYILTSADRSHKCIDDAVVALHGFVRCVPDSTECGVIYGCGAGDKGDVKSSPALKEAYEAGKNL